MDIDDFQRVGDSLPEASILLDSQGKVLAFNNSAQRFFKETLKLTEAVNTLPDIVSNSNEELCSILQLWSRSKSPTPAHLKWKLESEQLQKQWRCQGFMVSPAGHSRPARLMLRCLPGSGPLSKFSVLNEELARTQRTLAKLLNTREELEKEHELAQVTLKSIGDAVITTNIKGEIESINPIAERLTAWSQEEARGRPCKEVFHIVDELSRTPFPDPVETCIYDHEAEKVHSHAILISRSGTEYMVEESVAPIRNNKGEVLGVVLVFHDVTGERLARRQLEYLARHDNLTGLTNRYYFEQELDKAVNLARRGHLKFAMLYVDLDHFKSVNDTAGHAAGDELLRDVAKKLSDRLRRGDVLARLGGDEFGVLLQDVNSRDVTDIARSYKSVLDEFTYQWDNKDYEITASIGVSIIDEKTQIAAEVMRQADVACYVAKGKGRDFLHLYRRKDEGRVINGKKDKLLATLRRALRKDNFLLYFQPVKEVSSKQTKYFEILLRLNDEGNILAPNLFLPIAERHGLMPEVDKWVIRHAFEIVEQYQSAGVEFSINLSGASFEDEEVLDLLTRKFRSSQQLAESVIIEITETSALRQVEHSVAFMKSLMAFGVRFALDDFGTGFSSFAYLKRLPIDLVKIDGLFVKDISHDPSDLAMVRSINQIVHSLNKKTVAEYVENAEIQSILEEIGVDFLQGYHIGMPGKTLPPI